MAQSCQAAFVTLFPVGAPWSERAEGETFAELARYVADNEPRVVAEALALQVEKHQIELVASFTISLGGIRCASHCLVCRRSFF